MFELFTRTIPKGISEILFIGSVLGIITLFRNKQRDRTLFFLLTAMLFMVLWRLFLSTKSSRYVSVLIIFASVFSAYFFGSCTYINKSRFLLIVAALMFMLMRSIRTNHTNYSIYAIGDYLSKKKMEQKDYNYLIDEKEFLRIKYYAQIKDSIKINYYDTTGLDKFCKEYTEMYRDTLISTRKEMPFPERLLIKKESSFVSKAGKHDYLSFYNICSKITCRAISVKDIADSQYNLIENGDLEELDSINDSYMKFKNNVKHYHEYYEPSEYLRTSKNMFFDTPVKSDSMLETFPCFTTNDSYAISGNHSALIRVNSGLCFLLFSTKYTNGKYNFSFLVQGKVNTEVGIIVVERPYGKRIDKVLGSFSIPDKRLFCISANIDVEGFKEKEFILVGAEVINGEAYLDNFILTRQQ